MKDLDEAKVQLEKTTNALKEAVNQMSDADTLDTGTEDVKPKKSKKTPGSNRGIETMFRSAYKVQLALTGLADNKANMMISINGIIISIIIASVAPKLDSNPWLLIPTSLLLTGTLVSIVFAILAAKPRVGSQVIDMHNFRESEGNILFFGNFCKLKQSEFLEGMCELMKDNTVIYEAMIRDIHGLGSVLYKKFSLLQVAYTSFMIALILGVTSFIGVFIWIFRVGQSI